MDVINFTEKLSLFEEHWSPRIIAQMNETHFKLAKIKGEFTWHSHPETDETFIVLAGSFQMQLRDKTLILNAGEMCVVPKGVEHRPAAAEECHILLVEPAGTVNTGDAGGDLTQEGDEWV
jgi:mannose-6-phosphate isomerase-like protein (cupin superfamily)